MGVPSSPIPIKSDNCSLGAGVLGHSFIASGPGIGVFELLFEISKSASSLSSPPPPPGAFPGPVAALIGVDGLLNAKAPSLDLVSVETGIEPAAEFVRDACDEGSRCCRAFGFLFQRGARFGYN